MAAQLVQMEPLDGNGERDVARSGEHVLTVGGEEFTCSDAMPIGTMMQYASAEADLVSIAEILKTVVHADDHARLWRACDRVGVDALEAVQELMAGYMDRPTQSASPSSAGSKRTKAK